MDLQTLEADALAEIERLSTPEEADAFQVKFLGRKDGALTRVLRQLKDLPDEQKRVVGQAANRLREQLESRLADKRSTFHQSSLRDRLEKANLDPTLPGDVFPLGSLHPIVTAIDDITRIFRRLGFDDVQGPEIETDRNNFTDLNIPENHPARDLHDTFYVDLTERGDVERPMLLRTHTSPVQIRLMKRVSPPVRIVAPGRVFRHEAVDATHAAIFHQVEGLAVDEGITMGDLKGTLTAFSREYLGADLAVRFRPSYFPFVEPGAEMDVQCFRCRGERRTADGQPCGLCKASGWIELLGAGMVHPQVFRNVGYDPERFTGFAFGMGIERVIMTRHRVPDIRLFLESDLRFLEQFR